MAAGPGVPARRTGRCGWLARRCWLAVALRWLVAAGWLAVASRWAAPRRVAPPGAALPRVVVVVCPAARVVPGPAHPPPYYCTCHRVSPPALPPEAAGLPARPEGRPRRDKVLYNIAHTPETGGRGDPLAGTRGAGKGGQGGRGGVGGRGG